MLNQLQDIAAAVAQRHEPRIERGHRKTDRLAAGAKPSEVVNRSVRQLHQDLPVELEALNQRIEDSRDRLAKNERLAREATLKAERLADNAAKSDAARKTAEIYRRRAEAARADLEAAEVALADTQAKVAAARAALAETEAGRARSCTAVGSARGGGSSACVPSHDLDHAGGMGCRAERRDRGPMGSDAGRHSSPAARS
ncbi:hypothetical protein [Ancylobacter polymorphus]|uniref:hypothetical protein n=1 Tax=Ancylobacter polymorphus TaxID=223390 RepID=UPI0027D92FE4|nr:hypothetical protein [Ancylobacter polymorphus]